MSQHELFPDMSPEDYALQSGKMFQELSQATAVEILGWCSGQWRSAGRWTSRGEFWTLNGSEWPKDGGACFLSQILEANAPAKYYLSPRACKGILRRAEKRGKDLPPALRQALTLTSTDTGHTGR